MRRKIVIIAIAAIAGECTAIFLILMFIFHGNPSSGSYVGTYNSIRLKQSQDAHDDTAYNIQAEVEVLKNKVIIKEEVILKKPADKIYVYVPSDNLAKTEIKKVSVGKGYKAVSHKDTLLEVDCSSAQDKLYIEYEIRLDNKSKTLLYSNDRVILTNFLITPAVYRNGTPVRTYKSALGDPYIYESNNYRVTLKADRSYRIYAPGKQDEQVSGKNRIATFKARNLRDFPAVLFTQADVFIEKHGATDIYYINSRNAREYVKHAFDFAADNIGLYPYKELFIVSTPLSQQGMEYSNMILISDSCFGNSDELKRVTSHEIMHQWFYGVVGIDQLDEPFLDEGLVSCLTQLLYGNRNKYTYSSRFIGMQLSDYRSREEYYSLAYNEASAFFQDMYSKMGDNFYKLLHTIYEDKKYKILYFDDLKKYQMMLKK